MAEFLLSDRSFAGKEELEMALQKWGESAECHQWYVAFYFLRLSSAGKGLGDCWELSGG